MPSPTYFFLGKAEVTGSTSANLTFNNISSEYDDLLLKYSLRADSGNLPSQNSNFARVTLNSNSMSDMVVGESDSTGVNSSANPTIGSLADGNMGANIFSVGEAYLTAYQVTGTKIISFRNTINNNSAGTGYSARQQVGVCTFNNPTGAVTDIVISPSTGNFVQYSSIYLYGIKKS